MGYTAQDLGCCCSGSCTVAICVNCNSTAVSGASVTAVPQAGGTTLSGTTSGSGCISFTTADGFVTGNYLITVTASGHASYSAILYLSCTTGADINLCCQMTITPCICSAYCTVPGIAVTVTSGAFSVSGLTDSSGNFTFTVPSSYAFATFSVTASYDNFVAATDTFTARGCGWGNQPQLGLASGQACPCSEGVFPCTVNSPDGPYYSIPSVLTLNDGIGDITLTLGGTSWCQPSSDPGIYVGCATRSFTNITYWNGTALLAGNVTLPVCFTFACGGTGAFTLIPWIIQYQFYPDPDSTAVGCGLTIPAGDSIQQIAGAVAIIVPLSCNPFDWTATISNTCTAPINTPVCGLYGASVTYTVTP